MGSSEIEGQSREGSGERAWQEASFKFVSQKRLRKNLNSDDHFDRPFSFVAMKGKIPNQKERDHLNNNPSLKKITTHTKERKNNESTNSV
jgi:hypothetical protein